MKYRILLSASILICLSQPVLAADPTSSVLVSPDPALLSPTPIPEKIENSLDISDRNKLLGLFTIVSVGALVLFLTRSK